MFYKNKKYILIKNATHSNSLKHTKNRRCILILYRIWYMVKVFKYLLFNVLKNRVFNKCENKNQVIKNVV
jgi:hypothetical protein